MENLIGKWGGTRLQNIVWNNQPEFVHPDDWENLKNYKYIKSLHKFISKSDDYLLIGFGETKIRVVDSIFYPFDFTPKYTPLRSLPEKT